MRKIVDITRERFHRYLVLEFDGVRNHRAHWKCLCDCGTVKVVCGKNLRNGNTKSCGCLKKERISETHRIDLTGQRFDRWLVLEFAYSKNGRAYWKCLCDCETVKNVDSDGLRSGKSKSCGCLQREGMRGKNNLNYNPNLTDEDREVGRKYPEYHEWYTAIFERDDYTCQCCGKRGGKLAAHHLDGYNNFPELRTTLENGITLCAEDEDCHRNFHHQYGYGSNTREQFEEFLLAQRKLKEKEIKL